MSLRLNVERFLCVLIKLVLVMGVLSRRNSHFVFYRVQNLHVKMFEITRGNFIFRRLSRWWTDRFVIFYFHVLVNQQSSILLLPRKSREAFEERTIGFLNSEISKRLLLKKKKKIYSVRSIQRVVL